jgi:transposase
MICERKVTSDPEAIGRALGEIGGPIKRVGLEAGPLSQWLYEGLGRRGWPAICVDPRHMKASLSAMRNKTDENDARGIAQMMRVGLFRVVHVKSRASHELRLLLTNRNLLRRECLDIENEIRGSLKIFGFKVGRVTRFTFERPVRELIGDQSRLEAAIAAMLRARQVLFEEFARLHRLVLEAVRRDEICRRFTTQPGVGPITALAFRTAVEKPERFAKSKTVGAHFGLTPRKYNSGQIDYQGHISSAAMTWFAPRFMRRQAPCSAACELPRPSRPGVCGSPNEPVSSEPELPSRPKDCGHPLPDVAGWHGLPLDNDSAGQRGLKKQQPEEDCHELVCRSNVPR